MPLPAPVQSAIDQFTTALSSALAPGPGIGTPVQVTPTPWWKPSLDQATALASAAGQPVGNILGWTGTGPNTSQTKLPALALGDVAGAQKYAAFGYRPDGTHWVWSQAWLAAQRAFADQIAVCATGTEAAALVPGCQSCDTDAVIYAIMTGIVNAPSQRTAFETVQFGGGQAVTMAQVVAALQAQTTVTPGGAGPSGN